MNLVVETKWVMLVLLVTIRLGVVLYATPLLTYVLLPHTVKILFVIALSATMVSLIGVDMAQPVTLSNMMAASASELMIGGVLAFGVMAAFAAFQFGGRVLDMQMGFAAANLIDPTTRSQSPLMGTVLSMTALLIFFIIDGHHWLLRGLQYSLVTLPPGQGFEVPYDLLIAQFGAIFVYGLMAVAPALFVLSMIDVVIAVMARTMPQMNVFFVSIPLKVLVGLIVFAISLAYVAPFFEKVFRSMFVYWQGVMS